MREVGYRVLNAVQGAFLGLTTVSCSVMAVASAAVDRRAPFAVARKVWAPGLIWISGSPVEIVPGPAIDFSKPHVFVMNHQSMFDIPLALAAIDAPLHFVAKHTLRRVPFLGWGMQAVGALFVDRQRPDRAVRSLTEAADKLREGGSLLAFPEGTRSRTGKIQPFKKGVFRIAIDSGVPIVPLAVEGAQHVLPPDSFRIRPHPCRLKFGEPIPTAGLREEDRDALLRQVRNALIELHRSIGGAGGDPEPAIASPARAAAAGR